jgi:hypothetical protein
LVGFFLFHRQGEGEKELKLTELKRISCEEFHFCFCNERKVYEMKLSQFPPAHGKTNSIDSCLFFLVTVLLCCVAVLILLDGVSFFFIFVGE